MARSKEQIIQDIGALMSAAFGNNPMSAQILNIFGNPTQYPSNKLVILANIFAQSTVLLEQKYDALKYLSRVDQLSGALLASAAAEKCIFPRECVKAKQLMMFNGVDCTRLEAGAEFQDLQGRTWLLSEAITLTNIGGGCAGSVGIVESDVCECRTPELGTISPSQTIDGIYAATNILLLEKGGASESDADLRNRITSAGPLAHIQGTQDYATQQILALSGVNWVETVAANEYDLGGYAYIVHGGDDAEICNVIKRTSGNCANLIGNVSCDINCFNDVRFQRPMPVIIDVTACLPANCPSITAEQAIEFIKNTSSGIARAKKIRSCDFSKVHPELDSVTFNATYPPLITCTGGEIYTDPIDGSEIDFFGQNFCEGIPNDCAHCPQGPLTSLDLKPWQYAVIGNVVIIDCPEPPPQC